jgi:hypothetical protein
VTERGGAFCRPMGGRRRQCKVLMHANTEPGAAHVYLASVTNSTASPQYSKRAHPPYSDDGRSLC